MGWADRRVCRFVDPQVDRALYSTLASVSLHTQQPSATVTWTRRNSSSQPVCTRFNTVVGAPQVGKTPDGCCSLALALALTLTLAPAPAPSSCTLGSLAHSDFQRACLHATKNRPSPTAPLDNLRHRVHQAILYGTLEPLSYRHRRVLPPRGGTHILDSSSSYLIPLVP